MALGGNKGLSVFIDDEDYETFNLGFYYWYPLTRRSTTYAQTQIKRKTILLHRLIMGLLDAPRSIIIDHIDHNGLNNYKTNLRVTNSVGNSRNQHKTLSVKSSIYKGVSWAWSNNHSKPWQAYIGLSGKKKCLGYYGTEIEAARAYNKAALDLFGPYALLNIIEP